MNSLAPEAQEAVLRALTEGCSMRSTERLTGVTKKSIGRLLIRAGATAQRVLDEELRNLDCADITVLSIRLKRAEREAVDDAAHTDGMKPSAWAREQIIKAVTDRKP